MERIAPPGLALEGDPVGLSAGDPDRPVERILVALDATMETLAEAKVAGAGMIVSHHPRFYRGLKTLAATDASGRRALAIAGSGVALYSAHTNLDIAPGGTNDLLADAAGLRNVRVAVPRIRETLLKLVVFVPASHAERVRAAVCAAGAGAVGRYSDCTFRARGTGTFKGGPGTNPFLGKPGTLEEADEFRVETVVGEFSLPEIVAAMLRAHPYEEVAYDVFPLRAAAGVYGLGRIGDLGRPGTLSELARRMAATTGSTSAQYAGDGDMPVTRIATWAGGGVDGSLASLPDIEAVVVGEIGYHETEAFLDRGIGVVALGHDFSEMPVLPAVAERLRTLLPGVNVSVARSANMPMRNV